MCTFVHMNNAQRAAKAIQERITSTKKRRGITDAHLIRATGLGRSAYKARMAGKTDWSVSELILVAEGLDVPFIYLITGEFDHEQVAA